MKKIRLFSVIVFIILSLCSCFPDAGTVDILIQTQQALAANTPFTVHFIDVGQADASIVQCDGKSMMIDGGNADDSNLIVSYLKKLNITHLDYIICTHAHEDHVGGLAGALNQASVSQAFAPVKTFDSKAFKNFVKYIKKQGLEITIPQIGSSIPLGSANIQFLGPQKDYENANDTSIVLRIVYRDTSFLFTGDAEWDAEHDILEKGYELESTVLKVGHHGSSTSTSYVFLRAVMPEYAVISVGKKNDYGHPHNETLSRLRDAGVTLFRSDLQGDIICTSDGKKVSFTVGRNAGINTYSAKDAATE